MMGHRRYCRAAPPPRNGPTYMIDDGNLDSFLADHTKELAWVKGFTSKDKPRAILPPPPPKHDPPSYDVIVKAGDDDEFLNEDVFVEKEEELEPEGATAYPAMYTEKPTCRPAPGLPRPRINSKLGSRGRGVRKFTLTAEEITTRRISVEAETTTTMVTAEAPKTTVQTTLTEVMADADEDVTTPEQAATRTSETDDCTYTILSEQCEKTGRNVAAIGDLIPTKKSTELTIQRVYLDDVPMPGRYELRRDDVVMANATISAFPQNVYLQRWGHEPHDNSDAYVAYVWTTDTIPPTMAAWMTVDVAVDDGDYELVSTTANAEPIKVTVSSDWLFRA